MTGEPARDAAEIRRLTAVMREQQFGPTTAETSGYDGYARGISAHNRHLLLAELLDDAIDSQPIGPWPDLATEIANYLRAHRDRVLLAFDGEIEGEQHDCSPDRIHEVGDECGYPWCARSSKSGVLWSFPKDAPE